MVFLVTPNDEGWVPFKVGMLRDGEDSWAFVWVVGKRGGVKPAMKLINGNTAAIVKLEVGDTIFYMRTSLIACVGALNYYVEGQNIRSFRNGGVVGPEIAQWVSSEFIPVGILAAIKQFFGKEIPHGNCFVGPDAYGNRKVDDTEKSLLVFSTEPSEDVEPIIPDTRDGIFGKKRRAV